VQLASAGSPAAGVTVRALPATVALALSAVPSQLRAIVERSAAITGSL
jgi:hypothetical protein